jgi:hypothetical protein
VIESAAGVVGVPCHHNPDLKCSDTLQMAGREVEHSFSQLSQEYLNISFGLCRTVLPECPDSRDSLYTVKIILHELSSEKLFSGSESNLLSSKSKRANASKKDARSLVISRSSFSISTSMYSD